MRTSFPQKTCSSVFPKKPVLLSFPFSLNNFYFLQIIRHNNPAFKELSGLLCVSLFARIDSLLLGVIEDYHRATFPATPKSIVAFTTPRALKTLRIVGIVIL